jgi:hypothetical protein
MVVPIRLATTTLRRVAGVAAGGAAAGAAAVLKLKILPDGRTCRRLLGVQMTAFGGPAQPGLALAADLCQAWPKGAGAFQDAV